MYILRTSKWLLEYLVLLFHPKRLLIFFLVLFGFQDFRVVEVLWFKLLRVW